MPESRISKYASNLILRRRFIVAILLCLSFLLTNPNVVISQSENPLDNIKQYVFLGHTKSYTGGGDRVDERIEKLDLVPYEGVWLGGDLCGETLMKHTTLSYIDSLFNLSDPNTYWALGNHDARHGNLEWIEEISGRKTYYAHYQNNITSIIINTTLVPIECEQIEDQFEIIKNVCDTIQKSSHLIILMHHCLWNSIPGLPICGLIAHSDLKHWNANCDSTNTNFNNIVYPMLIEVKNRGINVICILGDTSKSFDQQSDDGIQFLASGIHNDPEDDVLILRYELLSRELTWGFHNLDSLLLTQDNKNINIK